MKKDDLVTIYEDPITRALPEGKARLVTKLYDGADGLERWEVRFRRGEGTFERWIKVTGVQAEREERELQP